MIKKIVLAAFAISAFCTAGCKDKADDIKAGSLCTVEAGRGEFGIVKVLVIDEQEAHIKVYTNKYSQRPTTVAIKELSMGSVTGKGGFGIGHIPLDRKGFDNSNRTYAQVW